MSLDFIKTDINQAKALGLNVHKKALLCEIEILKTKIQPHDTGHIYTTISTLQERCKEIDSEIMLLD